MECDTTFRYQRTVAEDHLRLSTCCNQCSAASATVGTPTGGRRGVTPSTCASTLAAARRAAASELARREHRRILRSCDRNDGGHGRQLGGWQESRWLRKRPEHSFARLFSSRPPGTRTRHWDYEHPQLVSLRPRVAQREGFRPGRVLLNRRFAHHFRGCISESCDWL